MADLTDSTGAVVRLSDDAVSGAVTFMAKAKDAIEGGMTAETRESLLRTLVASPKADAEAALRFVNEQTDPLAVRGFVRMLNDFPAVCRVGG